MFLNMHCKFLTLILCFSRASPNHWKHASLKFSKLSKKYTEEGHARHGIMSECADKDWNMNSPQFLTLF